MEAQRFLAILKQNDNEITEPVWQNFSWEFNKNVVFVFFSSESYQCFVFQTNIMESQFVEQILPSRLLCKQNHKPKGNHSYQLLYLKRPDKLFVFRQQSSKLWLLFYFSRLTWVCTISDAEG